jgi:uncharacterized Zn-binding protein involved in type VI secretion
MPKPAAKEGDLIQGTDQHMVMVPSGPSLAPTPMQLPFSGPLRGGLSRNVRIGGKPAATVGSTARNTPPHAPLPPGVSFQKPPGNQGTIHSGSTTVRINGKAAARAGDPALTCNDPADLPKGKVMAGGTVRIG